MPCKQMILARTLARGSNGSQSFYGAAPDFDAAARAEFLVVLCLKT
jgi:hypothetical protein